MAIDHPKDTTSQLAFPNNTIGPIVNGVAAMSISAQVVMDTTSTGSGNNRVLSVPINGTSTGFRIGVNGSAPKKFQIGARSVSTDAITSSLSTTTVVNGTKYHFGAVFDFAGDRNAVYLDGVKETDEAATYGNTTYTNGTPSGGNDSIGSDVVGTSASKWDGSIAEIGIWGVELTQDQWTALAKGFSPKLINPDNLLMYIPLYGRYSDERCEVTGSVATYTGTGITYREHPIPTWKPSNRRRIYPKGATATWLAGSEAHGWAGVRKKENLVFLPY